MSRIRRARLELDLYFQMMIVVVVLTAALVLEELDPRPGDLFAMSARNAAGNGSRHSRRILSSRYLATKIPGGDSILYGR